jgi:hypothetical protein
MGAVAGYRYFAAKPEKLPEAEIAGVTAMEQPSPAPALKSSDTAYAVGAIPFEEADWIAPFRGAEKWHESGSQEVIPYPTEASPRQSLDVYKRTGLRWDELEKEEGRYDFSPIDQLFRSAIARRQKVGFGIMTQYPGQPDGPADRGAKLAYPPYLHARMQEAAEEERDYISPEDATFWVPNYNSEAYLSRFAALLKAIAAHIQASSHAGFPYRNAWGYADIRGYGSWGEWHMVSAASSAAAYPAGRKPTAASLKRIVDAHVNAFTDVPLVAIISAFDADRLKNTLVPAEVGHHILTTSNRWGKIGWRRDNWGWTEQYLSFWLENNEGSYQGMRFDTAIMNRWKYAPVLGEGPCGGTAKGGPCPFYDMPRQVRFYHASMIGNGNFCGEQGNPQGRDSMRMAWKWSGYRMGVRQVVLDKQNRLGNALRVRIDWQNTGVAPLYEHWDTWLQLEDPATGKVVWSGKSMHTLRLKLPSSKSFAQEDRISLPSSVGAGRYALSVVVRDPKGYRDPLPLAIPGRRKDGSYLLVPALEITRP